MSNLIIETLTPMLSDIGIVALFITIVGVVFRMGKVAFTRGELVF